MKKLLFIFSIIFFLSCSKDNPVENPIQENVQSNEHDKIELFDNKGHLVGLLEITNDASMMIYANDDLSFITTEWIFFRTPGVRMTTDLDVIGNVKINSVDVLTELSNLKQRIKELENKN